MAKNITSCSHGPKEEACVDVMIRVTFGSVISWSQLSCQSVMKVAGVQWQSRAGATSHTQRSDTDSPRVGRSLLISSSQHSHSHSNWSFITVLQPASNCLLPNSLTLTISRFLHLLTPSSTGLKSNLLTPYTQMLLHVWDNDILMNHV